MHPALRKGPRFFSKNTPHFPLFFTKKHAPISFPAYGPEDVVVILTPDDSSCGRALKLLGGAESMEWNAGRGDRLPPWESGGRLPRKILKGKFSVKIQHCGPSKAA